MLQMPVGAFAIPNIDQDGISGRSRHRVVDVVQERGLAFEVTPQNSGEGRLGNGEDPEYVEFGSANPTSAQPLGELTPFWRS